MEKDEIPDVGMTPLDVAMSQMAEIIKSLKRKGVTSQESAMFAAVFFALQSSSESDSDDD